MNVGVMGSFWMLHLDIFFWVSISLVFTQVSKEYEGESGSGSM